MIFDQLFESFRQLEKAIRTARSAVEKNRPVKTDLVERLDAYEEILSKQRDLAHTLHTHALRHDWNEVARHIKIINALSQMIRDDAMEIVTEAQLPPPAGKPEQDGKEKVMQ